jgi:hypothetical protein
MESVLGEPFPEDKTFAQALKDGQVCMCVFVMIMYVKDSSSGG